LREPGGPRDERLTASCGLIGVALRYRLLDSAQQFNGLAFIFQGRALGGDAAQIDDTGHQRSKQAVGHGIAAAAYQDIEEPVGCPYIPGDVRPLNGNVHIISSGSQCRNVGVGGARDAEPGHCGFQRGPHFVNLPRLIR
jgi:hypothetical protein